MNLIRAKPVLSLLALSMILNARADPVSPTCKDLIAVYAGSEDDFASIRSGVEVKKYGSIYTTFVATKILTGADSCYIRKSGINYEYYCRWEAGSDRQKLGDTYQTIRDSMIYCLKSAQVWRDDNGGTTRARLQASNEELVTYSVMAHYGSMPYYVYLTVKRH
jgi:hypothetical protein